MRAHSTVKLRGRIYAGFLLCATFILAPVHPLQAESVLHGPPYAALWTQPAHLAAGDDFLAVGYGQGIEIWDWPQDGTPAVFGRVAGDSVTALTARDSLCAWTDTGVIHLSVIREGRLETRVFGPAPPQPHTILISSAYLAVLGPDALRYGPHQNAQVPGTSWSPPLPGTMIAGALRDSTLAVVSGTRLWLLRLRADSAMLLDSLPIGVAVQDAAWLGDTLVLAAGFSGLRVIRASEDTLADNVAALTPAGAFTRLAVTEGAWVALDIFGAIEVYARGAAPVSLTRTESGGTLRDAVGRSHDAAIMTAERGLALLNLFTPATPFWSFQRHVPGAVRALTYSDLGLLALADFAGIYAVGDTAARWIGDVAFNAVDIDTGAGLIAATTLLGGTALFELTGADAALPLALLPPTGFQRTSRLLPPQLIVFNTNTCDSGVSVYDVSDPQQPVLSARSSLCATIRAAARIPGGLALAAQDSGIWIYDAPITQMSAPDRRTNEPESWRALTWRQGFLWSLSDSGEVARWIPHPDSVEPVDRTSGLGARLFDVWDRRLVTADDRARVTAWQWRPGLNLTPQGQMDFAHPPRTLRLVGDTLWVAAGDAVFRAEFEITAGVDDREPAIRPERLFLSPPYPNPFNAGVALELSLGPGDWAVTIYDLLGRRVQNWSGRLAVPGQLRLVWEPAATTPEGAGSGLYMVRAESGGVAETRKVLYIK